LKINNRRFKNSRFFICCFNTKRHTDRIEASILKENPEYKEQILVNTYKRLISTYTPEINPYYFAYDERKIKNDIINMNDEDYKY
jgi:hypothetical protein